jgi:hypothetical protein
MGKTLGKMHQYKIYGSDDGKKWSVIVDKSKNTKDVPHDYVELEKPAKARFLKMENLKMPTGKFALSGFRVFGKGPGKSLKSRRFCSFTSRSQKYGERRSIWMKWQQNPEADGYVIYWEIS